SMNRTAKLLGVSTPTIQAWLEQFAAAYAQKPEPEGRAVVIELDEMWHYLKKTTAAKLAVWQTGAIRFAVELEGRDGQTPVKDAGSGTRLTPAAPLVPGVPGRDAHPLREPPHPGDAVRHGACAPEGEALRGQGLCALP
ncbi:MAG TPA: hypothetical protein VIL21_07950, partial [Solirubrobacterales bacterium]